MYKLMMTERMRSQRTRAWVGGERVDMVFNRGRD